MEVIMSQDKLANILKDFKDANIYIPEMTNNQSKEVKYFIYNDNQTSGDVIAKLCHI